MNPLRRDRASLRRGAVLLFAALLLLSACASGDDASTSGEATEGAASVALLSGEFGTLDGSIDLGDLEGQDVVLWFWAPW